MTPNNRAVLAAALLACALLFASPANAALARAVGFDEKVDKAQAIILGEVTATRSEWDSQHRFILTWTTFKVQKTLKGTAAPEVTLVTPGGSVGDIHQSAIGIPAFRRGDDHVIFVKNTEVGPTVLFFDQGAYDVKPGGGSDPVVAPVSSEAIRVDTQRGVVVPAEDPRTLSDFEKAIRESMHRTALEKMEMIRPRPATPSLLSTMMRYKTLIAIALLGLAFATWDLLRRW